MMVSVCPLATFFNVVAVFVLAGTWTVLTAPDLPGTKLLAVAMFGAMKVISKLPRVVHPLKQS